jgi:RNA polymerase sigma-70 factor (ECF subfamily)
MIAAFDDNEMISGKHSDKKTHLDIASTLNAQPNYSFFESLYLEYHSYISAKAAWLVTNLYPPTGIHADDIVQETFAEAWRSIDKLLDHQHIRGWLLLTMRNKAMKLRDKEAKQIKTIKAIKEMPQEENAGEPPLLDFLEELCATDREALTLFYIDGMSTREMSEALKINEAAARKRLSRARKNLEILAKEKNILM